MDSTTMIIAALVVVGAAVVAVLVFRNMGGAKGSVGQITFVKGPRQGEQLELLGGRTRIGALDDNLRASGSVSWNKFIVLITLESHDDPEQEMWAGPVVFRGMSLSGMMHTMVGHGALIQENCAAYGYGARSRRSSRPQ